jgi:hypothetical protein
MAQRGLEQFQRTPRDFCEGKTCYSKVEAATARNQAMRRRDNHPKHLRIYECPLCGRWHLTSRRAKDERRPPAPWRGTAPSERTGQRPMKSHE